MINNNLYLASSTNHKDRRKYDTVESRNNPKMDTIKENDRYNNFENAHIKPDFKKKIQIE